MLVFFICNAPLLKGCDNKFNLVDNEEQILVQPVQSIIIIAATIGRATLIGEFTKILIV